MAPSKDENGLSDSPVNGTNYEVSKVKSDSVDANRDNDISAEEKGDSSLGLLSGLSVAAQRKDEYDINFEYIFVIFLVDFPH
jgi:hypothetical protein